jgi:uncharacterized RDD family membrane protein YckC
VSESRGESLILPDEQVTGEAVALDLPPASFATRALALSLDLFVLFLAQFLTFWVLIVAFTQLDEALGAALLLVSTVLLLVGVPVAVETLTRGRSLGKFAAGLRVVRDDGGPIRFRQALTRGLVSVFEFYLPPLFFSTALISSLTNPRGKRLGDRLAGTYVVRVRVGRGQPPVLMPAELAGWAVSADLGRLPDRLALAVRQFLNRTTTLHEGSRYQLGTRLANEVARYVAPPPPAGSHPERFLAAVLAERHRRDLNRLYQEAALRQARLQRRSLASPLSPASTRLIGD